MLGCRCAKEGSGTDVRTRFRPSYAYVIDGKSSKHILLLYIQQDYPYNFIFRRPPCSSVAGTSTDSGNSVGVISSNLRISLFPHTFSARKSSILSFAVRQACRTNGLGQLVMNLGEARTRPT